MPENISYESFTLASCQASLFTPDERVSNIKLIKDFLPHWEAIFNAPPTPLPDGLPPEVPILILNSSSGDWRCEISSLRVNIFWRKSKPDSPDITPNKFFSESYKILIDYRKFLNARVGRIAAILLRYFNHDSPGTFLANHFCQDKWIDGNGPINKPDSFELHSHKRYSINSDFNVNSWIRCKTGLFSDGPSIHPIILIEQDINTLSEDEPTKNFPDVSIERFFSIVPKELDDVLSLYFPK